MVRLSSIGLRAQLIDFSLAVDNCAYPGSHSSTIVSKEIITRLHLESRLKFVELAGKPGYPIIAYEFNSWTCSLCILMKLREV